MVPSSRHGHWAVARLWPLAGPTGWKPRSESADLVRADLRWLPLALSTVGSEGQRSPQHCRAGALGKLRVRRRQRSGLTAVSCRTPTQGS